MFPSGEELSSDLEYLLQNGEIAGLALIEALVRQFYAPVYQLALAITDDVDSATYATIETFVSAMLETHRYRADEGVSAWLYAQSLPICRSEYRRIRRRRFFKAILPFISHPSDFGISLPESELDATLWLVVDTLPEQQRLAVLLHILLGMNEAEIGCQFKVEEKEVLTWFVSAFRKAWEKLSQASLFPDTPEPLSIEKLLSNSLGRRCPRPEFSLEEIETIVQEILYQVSRRNARRKRLVYIREIVMTGLVSLLVVGLIWGGNHFLSEPGPTTAAGAPRQAGVTPKPSPSPTPWRMVRVSYYPQAGDTLGLVAEKLDLPLSALVDPWTGQQISRDPVVTLQPDESLEFRVRSDVANLSTSTPVQPVMSEQDPLNAQSSLEQVRSRIAQSESLWRTLWADLSFVYYGPQGYVGPALQSARVWVWMQLPGASLTKEFMDGSPFMSPVLVKDGIRYEFGSGFGVSATPQEELLPPELSDLLLPARSEWFKHGRPIRVLGQQSIAGRQLIFVQWEVAPGAREYPPSPVRLYGDGYLSSFKLSLAGYQLSSLLLTVDAQTGVVLRIGQYLDKDGRSTLIEEAVASQIAFDVNFSQPGLFDPFVTGLLDHTQDYSGRYYSDIPAYVPPASASGREPIPRTAPPPGYDPSADLLTFQYPLNKQEQGVASKKEVDLFAGKYFLRSLQLDPISAVVCDRSQEGSHLAYLSSQILNGDISQEVWNVQWLDLRRPAEIHTPLSKLSATDLAFSPDGRYLAIAGFYPQSGRNGIYILDTTNDKVELLLPVFDAWSLVWSPDGKSLAFIGTLNPENGDWAGQHAAVVVNVSSKEIVYHAETPDEDAFLTWLTTPNERGAWPPPDWPVYQWGVLFPVFRGMLGNCTQPPL